jgi:methylase of polypeptide subunit release factors
VSQPHLPILDAGPLDALRAALAGFTPDCVQAELGLGGQAAHARGDLLGVERALSGDDPLPTLIRLFLLGLPVPAHAARAALAPLRPEDAPALLEVGPDGVRARLEVRPYAAAHGDDSWCVVSDFGSDVRPGPLAADHVLGIGAASLTLAQATVRQPVQRALDLGTGCGVQALHLSGHAASVTATDVSERALRLAATTAALSGQHWELRGGSLLEPVAAEQFDLIVANPPFVVSPGGIGYDYRDSGLAGDGVSRTLVTALPDRLRPGGLAQLLANWVITADQPWDERIGGWLAGRGVDAWVWQREIAEPGEYVSMWLRDAGDQPGTARWRTQYSEWLDWFATHGVLAVGMGLVSMWRTDRADPVLVCEDVPHAVEQPAGAHLPGWIRRHRWLAEHDDRALLKARLRRADDLVRTRQELAGPDGWYPAASLLRQSHAMRWELQIDDAVAAVVAACTGEVQLGATVAVLAAALRTSDHEVSSALLPVIRDLIGRGFLEPPASGPDGRPR